jgi:hypothetical protein
MIEAIYDAVTSFAEWLYDLVVGIFESGVLLIHDAAVWAFDGVLGAIATGVEAAPVPDWLAAYSLGIHFAKLHPMVGYFVLGLGIPECLAVIGAAFTLRRVAKPLTLILPG